MVSAAILAGGRATRFGGCDKSALVVEGRTILERQLEVLRAVAAEILLVGRVDAPPVGVRAVADRVGDSGPLAGLDAALAAMAHDRLLLLACDMPFVTAPFAAYLFRAAEGVDAVVPRTAKGYHPLCAVYTRACGPVVARRLAAGQLAVKGLADELRVRVVESPEIERFGNADRLLANVNTPIALHELEASLDHKR